MNSRIPVTRTAVSDKPLTNTEFVEVAPSANSPLNCASSSFAFGEIRSQTGDSPTDYESKQSFDFKVKTDAVFTHTHGQRSYVEDFGLHFYVARWYDPYLNQFIQPDTIIPNPGNSGDWDRYVYVNYNPINFNDPTGHYGEDTPLIDGETNATGKMYEYSNVNKSRLHYEENKAEMAGEFFFNAEQIAQLMENGNLPGFTIETPSMLTGVLHGRYFTYELHSGFKFSTAYSSDLKFYLFQNKIKVMDVAFDIDGNMTIPITKQNFDGMYYTVKTGFNPIKPGGSLSHEYSFVCNVAGIPGNCTYKESLKIKPHTDTMREDFENLSPYIVVAILVGGGGAMKMSSSRLIPQQN